MSESRIQELTFKAGELAYQVAELKQQQYDMLAELHEAIFGDAEPAGLTQQELWEEMLGVVTIMRIVYVRHMQQCL